MAVRRETVTVVMGPDPACQYLHRQRKVQVTGVFAGTFPFPGRPHSRFPNAGSCRSWPGTSPGQTVRPDDLPVVTLLADIRLRLPIAIGNFSEVADDTAAEIF